MKAIVQDRYGSADVLEFRDIDEPPVGDDGVLLRVHAASVDPGVWHLMTGLPYLMRIVFGFRNFVADSRYGWGPWLEPPEPGKLVESLKAENCPPQGPISKGFDIVPLIVVFVLVNPVSNG